MQGTYKVILRDDYKYSPSRHIPWSGATEENLIPVADVT